MYGHSFDFVNSWSNLDNIFSRLKNSTFWNATSIEMANYLNALTKIVVINGRDFYNTSPTTSVWIRFNNDVKELGPLSTINHLNETQLIPSQCGTSLPSINTPLYCYKNDIAEAYEFELSRVNDLGEIEIETLEKTINKIEMSELKKVMPNYKYNIRVRIKHDGIWSQYGTACEITTPDFRTLGVQQDQSGVKANIFPNAYTCFFKVFYPTDKNEMVTVSIFDISGRLIEKSQHDVEKLGQHLFGQGLSAGVYNIILEQGTEITTLRVVKQ